MADLPTTLHGFFAAPQTRTLAGFAPLYLVAGASGLIIGAALAAPAFAAAGLGLVLTSLATNLTSSLVYDIVKPDLEAGERERAIAQGLNNRDPGVVRLVAEALAAGGPEVARAIPEPQRAELIDALRQGMRASGGALASIAPRYADALGSAQTDWAGLQAELRATIRQVSQTIEASAGGVISGGQQHADAIGGPVEQVMRATGQGSRVEHSSQVVGGAARPDALAAAPLGAREHLQSLLASHTRRLQALEQRAAREGLHAPPEVVIEIEELRSAIARARQQLGE